MSNYHNRKSVMPDVSPKAKSNFNVRNRVIAIMCAAAFIVLLALWLGAFDVRHNEENVKTAATLKEKESDLLEAARKIAEREKELDEREAKLATREASLEKDRTNLAESREELEKERDALADEKALFGASQLRAFELSKSLYEELAPYYSPADPAIVSENE